MMNTVTLPLGLSLLLATTAATFAQATPEQAAVEEGIRRQADRITLRQKLVDARAAEERHDLPNAARLYGVAWDLVQKIGPSAGPEADQTRSGYVRVHLELARAAQRHGDLREA